ncbi:MAG: FHA domain-containing protein [Deltaproteobacteria bacterium]|nr:FHA domain-containing protein [Deltaproteobacteria bacterium]
MTFKITVEDSSGPVQEILLRPGIHMVGRSAACDIRIDTAFMSRRHAKLVVAGDKLEIFDLDSHNGMFVNGLKVRDSEIVPGDIIYLGTRRLLVAKSGDEAVDRDLDSQLVRAPLPVEMAQSLDALQQQGADLALDAADPMVRNLAILYRVSERFGRAESVEELMRDALDLVRELTQATTAALLVADDGGKLEPKVTLSDPAAPRDDGAVVSWPVARKVLAEGHALFSRDIAADASLVSGLWDLDGVGAVMCVPLLAGQRAIGCIYLTRPFADAGFTDREVETVNAVAHLLAGRMVAPTAAGAPAVGSGELGSLLQRAMPSRMVDRLQMLAIRGAPTSTWCDREDGVLLFADLVGFGELVPTAPTALISLVLGRFQYQLFRVTEEHQGTVETTHDSGALAFFPGEARQAVPRAARAALALARVTSAELADGQASLGVRVGLDLGSVVSGLFGDDNRRVYTTVGVAVRTATRVAELAQLGQVLCTGPVRDALGEVPGWQLVALGPHSLRGRPEPVVLFLVSQAPAAAGEGE